MKAVKFVKCAAQGDVLFERVETLPEGLVLDKQENGVFIVTHSETGHHHVIDSKSAQLLIDKTNAFVAYLNVLEPCEVKHMRNFDTHRPIMFDKGVYRVRRQREHTPQGWRKAQD